MNLVEEKISRFSNNNEYSSNEESTMADAVTGKERDSDIAKGLGFNRMMGDLGLIVGPLIIGFLFGMFKNNGMPWTMSLIVVSFILASVSVFLAGQKGTNMIGKQLLRR